MDPLPGDELALLVVGDGPDLPDLHQWAGNRRDVAFAGEDVSGVGTFFDAAYAYVLPGTGGLAVNEAMAHGLPVLSSYADGSADDLVVDGKTGYRVRDGGAAELAAKLKGLFADEGVTAAKGRRAGEKVTGPFSFERFLDRVEAGLVDAADG